MAQASNIHSLRSDSGAQSHTYTVGSSDATVTANYQTQIQVTVSNGGHGSPSQGTQWVNYGSSFSTSVSSPADVVSNDHQWICSQTTLSIGSVTSPQTLTFSWTENFWLASTGGNSVSGTSQWYTAGAYATATSNGVWGRSGGSGTRVASYNLDSGSNTNVGSTGTVSVANIYMTAAHTVNFNSATRKTVDYYRRQQHRLHCSIDSRRYRLV